MYHRKNTDRLSRVLPWIAIVWLGMALIGANRVARADGPHVGELAAYLEHAQIAEPVEHRHLAVYPIVLKGHDELGGRWLTLDKAAAQGVLVVTEKAGGANVAVVTVQNKSRDAHVFIMAGEVIAGGKQTRTVRQDVILAPRQQIELSVFCVEAHRWHGADKFSAGKSQVPQSILKELRKGADQQRVWSEVARNNQALRAENATGSLELAIKAEPVRKKLAEVRRSIVPKLPQGTVGFIFVDGRRAVGADFLGSEGLARELFPKLLDSYAVDILLQREDDVRPQERTGHRPAIDFFERVRRIGSDRVSTPGSGAGIRTRSGGLLGDGVGLGDALVHYGIQIQDRIVPDPKPLRPSRSLRRGDARQQQR